MDDVRIIKEVVCRVINTSSLIINNQDLEITNGYSGAKRVYENKKISKWESGDNEETYRVNVKSTSPFNFHLKAMSLDIT